MRSSDLISLVSLPGLCCCRRCLQQVSGGVDPTANVVTVVNDLSARGITLKAGELVITGAIVVTMLS